MSILSPVGAVVLHARVGRFWAFAPQKPKTRGTLQPPTHPNSSASSEQDDGLPDESAPKIGRSSS